MVHREVTGWNGKMTRSVGGRGGVDRDDRPRGNCGLKVLTGGVGEAVTGTSPAVHLLSVVVDTLRNGDTQSHDTLCGAVVKHHTSTATPYSIAKNGRIVDQHKRSIFVYFCVLNSELNLTLIIT